MKRLSLLALVALAALAGPAALAEGYMDLPGMAAAEKVAPAPEIDTDAAETEPSALTAESAAETAVEDGTEELLSPVRSMPGGGAIPVGGIAAGGTVEVGVGAAGGTRDPGSARGSILLMTLAGLGSLTSLAWLVTLRRQGVV